MTQVRRILGLALVGLLLSREQAESQLLVLDAGNLAQNTITAAESVLTTIQTILIELNQILDLTPLGTIATAGGLLEDMALLGRLVEEAQQIGFDLQSLESQFTALFHLDAAPQTTSELQQRLAEIRRLKQEAYGYASRVQTLMRTAMTTVRHMQLLLETLAQLIGNLQGEQLVAQHAAAMHKHLANIQTQQAAYYRARTLDRMEETVTIQGLININKRVFQRE